MKAPLSKRYLPPPSQAREFAEELLLLADNPLEQRKQLKIQVQAIQAHLDLHNRPDEL